MGLASEAGMPAVADPGSSVVKAAHELGAEVIPLPGPVSVLLALAASGLNGQNFAFVGYLPQDPAERTRRLRELESLALKTGQTQLFIETPYRNRHLGVPAANPAAQHALERGSGLTLPGALCRTLTAKAWKPLPCPVDNSTPAVFGIGR
jgi:16S rRNA (cytidine1402-2'-O)-methyltransferase